MGLKSKIKDSESFGVGLETFNRVLGDPRSKLFYDGLCRVCKKKVKRKIRKNSFKLLGGKTSLNDLLSEKDFCVDCLKIVSNAGSVFKK